jgi:hypothetical protein
MLPESMANSHIAAPVMEATGAVNQLFLMSRLPSSNRTGCPVQKTVSS